MSEVEKLKDEYARCLRAFHQDLCPRLGAALIQIAAALRVALRSPHCRGYRHGDPYCARLSRRDIIDMLC